MIRIPVSLRDLPSTVLELIDGSAASPFRGSSLARFWQGGPLAADTLLFETLRTRNRPKGDPTAAGGLQGPMLDSLDFTRGAALPPHLYNIDVDPTELKNLALLPANAAMVDHFHHLLDRVIGGARSSHHR